MYMSFVHTKFGKVCFEKWHFQCKIWLKQSILCFRRVLIIGNNAIKRHGEDASIKE